MAGGRLRVAGAEETVAYKLLFGSEQDVKDARSILARQGEAIDLVRLRALARRLQVSDRVEALLDEVGEASA